MASQRRTHGLPDVGRLAADCADLGGIGVGSLVEATREELGEEELGEEESRRYFELVDGAKTGPKVIAARKQWTCSRGLLWRVTSDAKVERWIEANRWAKVGAWDANQTLVWDGISQTEVKSWVYWRGYFEGLKVPHCFVEPGQPETGDALRIELKPARLVPPIVVNKSVYEWVDAFGHLHQGHPEIETRPACAEPAATPAPWLLDTAPKPLACPYFQKHMRFFWHIGMMWERLVVR